jgi:TolA-binding protein
MRFGICGNARTLGLCVLLAASVLCGSGATEARAGPSVGPVRVHMDAYDGRFEGHPRFHVAFGDLERQVERSLGIIEERLGLVPEDEGRIHVYVRDAARDARHADRARCHTRSVGGQEFHRVELFAEYFLSGDSDLPIVLTHELVHAVMRERMGQRAYERLPHWIREGLAVHVADEGERHLRRTLIATENVDKLLTGLMGRERELIMYPYAYLGVDYLQEKGGENALRRFVKGLVAGQHPRAMVKRITELEWPEFLKRLRGFARKRVQSEAKGLGDIRAALRQYRRGRYTRAREALEAFTKKYAGSAFAATARYYAARCLFKSGSYEEAEAAFAHCIEKDLGYSGWIDECYLFRGIALHEQERDDEAIETLTTYLDLHAYSDQRDLGYLALGRALRREGRDEDAREAFEAVRAVPRARYPHRRAARRELTKLEE